MISKYLTSSRLGSSHFSVPSLIQHPAPIFNTELRNLLPPLPFPLFLSPKKSFMMLFLKCNKNDGSVLSFNHFIYAKDVFSTPLSKLFTAMIRHSTVPTPLRDCILVPIPKPGKDLSYSDNYHPIALAPTLSKVFEWCLLFKFSLASQHLFSLCLNLAFLLIFALVYLKLLFISIWLTTLMFMVTF